MGGLLYDLHAEGCEGEERATCQPVVVPDHDQPTYHDHDRGARIEVVMMAWCTDCHAAEWEVV
jgi:hypothetical protein